MSTPSRFSFVDEGEAVRRLGIDRDTVLSLVRAGRLKAYPGVGKGSFFKLGDLLKLAEELHPAEVAPAEATPGAPEESAAPAPAAAKRPQHDPAYKVHLRLTADLKWYDLSDDELRAWVRELHPDAYTRQRTNITAVMARLRRLLSLMDEAAAHWSTVPAHGIPTDGDAAEDAAPQREAP
ncbi:MAG TPA: helix-turn-helix domain-containing protein [Ktedonobacterales bacterium]